MNWRFIFFFSPIGLFMGTLTVKGIGNPWVLITWILFCLLAAYMLARYDLKKWFLTALAIGTLWGMFHNLLPSIFFNAYLKNGIDYRKILSTPDGISARFWVVITGPLIGLASGFLIAIFTWILKKLVPVKQP